MSALNTTDPAAAQAALMAEYDALLVLLSDYRVTRIMWIISLALLLYDWFLTLPDEINYMWKGRFVWTKVLFFLNRYWPIANLIFDNTVLAAVSTSNTGFCFFWENFFAYSAFPTHFTIGTILILRIYAMYGRNRKLLIFLLAFFASQLITETVIIGLTTSRFKFVTISGISGCLATNIEPYAWAYWVPTLVFESTLFLLSIVKSFELAHRDTRTPHIMVILLRDSFVYFGGVLAVILTNFIVWKTARVTLFAAFPGTSFMVHSILGCRMLINIQKAGAPYYAPKDLSSFYAAENATSQSYGYAMRPVRMMVGSAGVITADETKSGLQFGEDA